MQKYMILDTFKYATPADNWKPIYLKPSTARYLLSGTTDVTYGPATPQEWRGLIRVDVTPQAGYGGVNDLKTTVAKRQAVAFTDHYGVIYNVHILGEIPWDSLTPMWDGASNVFHIPVRLVKA